MRNCGLRDDIYGHAKVYGRAGWRGSQAVQMTSLPLATSCSVRHRLPRSRSSWSLPLVLDAPIPSSEGDLDVVPAAAAAAAVLSIWIGRAPGRASSAAAAAAAAEGEGVVSTVEASFCCSRLFPPPAPGGSDSSEDGNGVTASEFRSASAASRDGLLSDGPGRPAPPPPPLPLAAPLPLRGGRSR
jgi:hypothetical protein